MRPALAPMLPQDGVSRGEVVESLTSTAKPAYRTLARPVRVKLRDEIAARLRMARAGESPPPERYGFSIEVATSLFTLTCLLYRRYFRTECFGIDTLPSGPALLVANHGSHVLSWDGANIVSACLLDATPPRLVHGMAEHRLLSLPVLGTVARRIGAVDGNRADCMSLLAAGAAVLTFPEGVRALRKPFRDRYHLAPFGHGFMRVAMASRVPIVPVAVIGAEEEAPLIANPRWLARLLRTPVAPITPTLFVPLPVKYRLYFGAPLEFAGPADADDSRIAANVGTVRNRLAALVRTGCERRLHILY